MRLSKPRVRKKEKEDSPASSIMRKIEQDRKPSRPCPVRIPAAVMMKRAEEKSIVEPSRCRISLPVLGVVRDS